MIDFARQHDCEACALKPKCCPNVPARKIARSIHEAARDKARATAKTEAYAAPVANERRSRCCSLWLTRLTISEAKFDPAATLSTSNEYLCACESTIESVA
jgi:hypothetical protein